MPEALAPRPRRSKREAHLLELAGDVERDDPVLACELRGMALHEAALAPFEPLEPKPYRMNLRRYKVPFPREGEDPELQEWLAEYERESRNFNTCKFIEQVGARHYVNDVVQLHDEITGANFRQPLA